MSKSKIAWCDTTWNPFIGCTPCSPGCDNLRGEQSEVAAIHWVIIGWESGKNRRECKLDWVRGIVNQCKTASVPVFVKQLDIGGKVSHDPADWPEDLRVRELPAVLEAAAFTTDRHG